LETVFWVKILKFFDADPGWKKFGSGIEKNSDLGSGINIPDPQHCEVVLNRYHTHETKAVKFLKDSLGIEIDVIFKFVYVFYSGLAALCLMGKEKLCDTESLLLWTAKRQMRLEGGFQVRARSDFLFLSGSGYFSLSVYPTVEQRKVEERCDHFAKCIL
jgi:hypothetical protein